ncbi:CapA family protein [Kosakonia pseudosacchari]|uniref:CapA family protein n=1 Tax=Kosakonia pseudosacchari TaxID=1646340 RepID=UPI000A389657|nr:CapA family protein [Kosakonia pseudosacchari]
MSTDAQNNNRRRRGWRSAELEALLGVKWRVAPPPGWQAEHIALTLHDKQNDDAPCLFIAMDEKTWHQGSGNRGIYAGWQDTHAVLTKHYRLFCGAIVQRYLPDLPPDFPQLVVENSYHVLPLLADEARRRMNGKIIAITGTVGKSSTKDLLHMLLAAEGTTVSTQGNHNTRTGTLVSLARCITDPDYVALEVAISALWMRAGGVGPRIKPHIVVITEIGMTQVGGDVKTPRDTARFKVRLCDGILPGGYAIINRDMDEYAFVHQEALRYGANVVSYGFHPQADVRIVEYQPAPDHTNLSILLNGAPLHCRLNTPGKGMAGNAVAALIALDLLGFDTHQAAQRLADFRNKPGKLQTSQLPLPAGGSATLIDDNYNATLISMRNAIAVAALYPLAPGQRRIAVLGRLATLGEIAKESHIALAKPLLDAGFDTVWLHGEEMQYLKDVLPAGRVGGHFSQIDALADAVMATLKAGDIVLVKGSVSDSDFHRIVGLMKTLAQRRATALKQDQTATLLMNLTTGERQALRHAQATFAPRNLSHLLLITLLASQLQDKTLRLEEMATVNDVAKNIVQNGATLGLNTGQQVSVKTLLQGLLIHNARDAAVNLAHLLGTDAVHLNHLARTIGLTQTQLNNVSGRLRHGQHTSLHDIATLVEHFYQRFPHLLHWFAESEMVLAGHRYRKASNIQADGRASYSYSAGGVPCWGFALQRSNNQLWLACAAGAADVFHLDYLLDGLLAKAGGVTADSAPEIPQVSLAKTRATVTLLGDTYFGEWYTRRRQRKGVDDALQRYGYDHSFQRLTPLLAGSDLTIANMEAALAPAADITLGGRKPFCLTGDPAATTAALKRHGIHAITLANNHALDAGVSGLATTLAAFRQQGILTFGAGMNASQAEAPLLLTLGGRRFMFYSAYWFRRYMEQDCAYYSLPRRAGVACISGGLIGQLRREKAREDPATLIVLAHWGLDYQWTVAQQRRLAEQLVHAGADLIIGAGAHMAGDMERVGESWVIYSLGNAVFNSNGEYQARNVPPYSLVASLQLGGKQPTLTLQPIFSDNQQTFWQPRAVNALEFSEFVAFLREQGVVLAEQPSKVNAWIKRTDNAPQAIVVPLDKRFGDT